MYASVASSYPTAFSRTTAGPSPLIGSKLRLSVDAFALDYGVDTAGFSKVAPTETTVKRASATLNFIATDVKTPSKMKSP